jgi:hypothetical protein
MKETRVGLLGWGVVGAGTALGQVGAPDDMAAAIANAIGEAIVLQPVRRKR